MINLIFPCEAEAEITEHFLLHCHCFSTQRMVLFDNVYNLNSSFSKPNTKDKCAYLLYGSANNPNSLEKDITEHVIKFLKSTGWFDKLVLLDQRKWNNFSVSYVSLQLLFCKFILVLFYHFILSLSFLIYIWLLVLIKSYKINYIFVVSL